MHNRTDTLLLMTNDTFHKAKVNINHNFLFEGVNLWSPLLGLLYTYKINVNFITP